MESNTKENEAKQRKAKESKTRAKENIAILSWIPIKVEKSLLLIRHNTPTGISDHRPFNTFIHPSFIMSVS